MNEESDPLGAAQLSDRSDRPSYVVGVGASAGGLEAIAEFFERIPPNCSAAFVVVQHLSPDFTSLMDEILARHTKLVIHRAEHGQLLESGAIYLLQPRKNITVRDGRIELVDQEPRQGLNLPIDIFFHSLARDAGDRAIGMVLSGTGSDGSRGIRAIKEVGGMVMVQDELTAKFDGMPRAAIATGMADFVLSPAELAEQLLRFVDVPSSMDIPPSKVLLQETTKLDEIVRVLRVSQRADFSLYKPSTVSRRIERRMGLNHITDLDQYLLLLRESETESAALTRDLLIGVTRFFRDNEVWEAMRAVVMPRILADAPQDEPLRFWVPSCSSGEEAYSLAMLVEEAFAEYGTRREVKIFATDIDQRAIEIAGEGKYAEIIAADVGPRRINQFFIKRANRYEVARSLREMVVFARHDLLKDPPFTKLHMISCRNFLIYVQPKAQQHVIAQLHFALRSNGFLLLGNSETPGDLSHGFKIVDEKLRIYQRDPAQSIPIVRHQNDVEFSMRLRTPVSTPDRGLRGPYESPSKRAFDYIARSHFPPALLVSSSFELVHTFGDVSGFLGAPPGAFTADIAKLAVDDLRIALTTALHKASKSAGAVGYRDVRIKAGSEVRVVNLHVEPIPCAPHEQQLFLVLFEEKRREPVSTSVEFDATEQKDSRIRDLEFELQQTKESLQATIEELETSNEELQSTNEELLASNEELQSTNEELHSVNEELYTVNAEYQSKIHELTRLTNDFDNLMRSTEIGTVFVDGQLRIRRFTPAVSEVLPLLDHDIGRPIQQFSSSLRGMQIGQCVTRVIQTGQPFEDEIQSDAGSWYLVRVLPFVNDRSGIDGAVMTLVPIDRLKASERARRESEMFLQATLDSLASEIAILDEQGTIIYVNNAWREFGGRNGLIEPNSALGINYLEVCERAAARVAGGDTTELRDITAGIRAVLDGRQAEYRVDYPCHSPTEQRWFTMRVRPFAAAGPKRLCVSHENITDRKLAEAALLHETKERRQREIEAQNAATHLSSIIDGALDGVITIDSLGTIRTANEATERLFGYRAAELVGNNVSMLMPAPDRDQHDQYLSRYLGGGAPRVIGIGREVRGLRKDGSTFPMHLAVTEYLLNGERHFTGFIRDVTAEVRQLDELRRTAELLQQTNRDLEQFTTIAAHDLHEPLRTIRGYCQLLRDTISASLDDAGQKHFSRIESAVGHLQGQIDALRRYSQIGPNELDRRSANVDQVIDHVLASLETKLGEANAHVLRQPMPVVTGNPEMLEQVFQNLIENAVKYRGQAKPEIVIKSSRKDSEWVFGVSDNGVGVRPEHSERIFQMFKRINPPTGSPGLGVGLAIAKRIVDKHGGRIWVESVPGQGSTFYFSLPAT